MGEGHNKPPMADPPRRQRAESEDPTVPVTTHRFERPDQRIDAIPATPSAPPPVPARDVAGETAAATTPAPPQDKVSGGED